MTPISIKLTFRKLCSQLYDVNNLDWKLKLFWAYSYNTENIPSIVDYQEAFSFLQNMVDSQEQATVNQAMISARELKERMAFFGRNILPNYWWSIPSYLVRVFPHFQLWPKLSIATLIFVPTVVLLTTSLLDVKFIGFDVAESESERYILRIINSGFWLSLYFFTLLPLTTLPGLFAPIASGSFGRVCQLLKVLSNIHFFHKVFAFGGSICFLGSYCTLLWLFLVLLEASFLQEQRRLGCIFLFLPFALWEKNGGKLCEPISSVVYWQWVHVFFSLLIIILFALVNTLGGQLLVASWAGIFTVLTY